MTDTSENIVTADAGVHTAYFYHLSYTNDEPTISAYQKYDEQSALGNVQQVAKDLADNHFGARNNPVYAGDEFEDIIRGRKGYLIVSLEGAQFDSRDPITFRCDSGSEPQSLNNDGRHTFTPLGTFAVSAGGKALSVTAYLYRAQSFIRPTNLGDGEREHYHIKFKATRSALVDIFYDDSGGTNLGPPPPPPGMIGQSTRE